MINRRTNVPWVTALALTIIVAIAFIIAVHVGTGGEQ